MIPILMDSTKKLNALVTDETCIMRLTDCLSCTVSEEANGAYTASLELPQTAENARNIVPGAIIKLKANPYDALQLFRISSVKRSIDSLEVEAKHITYDLSKTSVMPCSASNIAEAMETVKDHMTGGDEFTLHANSETKANFSNSIPQSCRALMGGQDGSLLDVYGGYYYWDNTSVTLGKRGEDSGVEIRYGKNLVTAEQEESIESMYTAVQPYATVNDTTVIGTYKKLIDTEPVRILNLDLSDKFQSTEVTPSVADIDKVCESYVKRNVMTEPKVSLEVTYEDLQKFGSQYKEEVKLCDIVHVIFEKLGISTKARVTSYEYDTLAEKYTSVKIGSIKSKLSDSITSIADSTASGVSKKSDAVSAQMNMLTTLITQGLGLFITRDVQSNGSVKIYLHNKPTLEASSVWYTINSNGLAISKNKGKTWTAGIDADGNAVFNILSANVIKAMQIYGTYINGATIEGGKIQSSHIIFKPSKDEKDNVTMDGITLVMSNGEQRKGLLISGKSFFSSANYCRIGDINTNSAYVTTDSDSSSAVVHGSNSVSISSEKFRFICGNDFISMQARHGDEYLNPIYYSDTNDVIIVAQNSKSSGIPVVGGKPIKLLLSSDNNYLFLYDDNGSKIGRLQLSH